MEQSSRKHENETPEIQAVNPYLFLNSFPPGYRFKPYDAELITKYLQPKINGQPLPSNLMHEINIYKHNPEYLAATFMAQGDKIWYFFTPRDRKYRHGTRPNRRAGDGYWKASGADKPIKQEVGDGGVIGYRKALVFYRGKPPNGDKTPWIMHEFKVPTAPSNLKSKRKRAVLEDTNMRLDDYVLCRIYKKEVSGKNQSHTNGEEPGDEKKVDGTDEHKSMDGVEGDETSYSLSPAESVMPPSNNTTITDFVSLNKMPTLNPELKMMNIELPAEDEDIELRYLVMGFEDVDMNPFPFPMEMLSTE